MAQPVASTSAVGPSGSGQSAFSPDFDFNASRDLLADLRYGQANPDSTGLVQNLAAELEEHADWLFTPTEFPGVIPGFYENVLKANVGKSITQEGADNIAKLAGMLQISEKICGRLLTDARLASARTGRSDLETAIQLYDELLLERMECLKAVWEEVPYGSDMDLSDYQRSLVAFRVGLFREREESGRSLLEPIVKQIGSLQALIDGILPGLKYSQANNVLQQEVKQHHLRILRRAQRDLAVVLFKVSRAGCLTVMEVWDLLLWVKKRDKFDEVTVMMLAALFSAMQSIDIASLDKPSRNDFISQFTLQLLDFAGYKLDWIPLVLLLSWGLRLDEAQHEGIDVELPPLPFRSHQKRKPTLIVRDLAIDNGALGYLLSHILPTDDKRAIWEADAERDNVPGWAREEWPMVQDDQRQIVLSEVLDIVRSLVQSPSNFVGTLRRNERDSKQSDLRGGYGRDRIVKKEEQEQFPVFVELVIALYTELPVDSDFSIWEEEALLASMAESKDIGQQILLAKLLLAIGNGPKGSDYLVNMLLGESVEFGIDQILLSAINAVQRLKPLQGEDAQRTAGLTVIPVTAVTVLTVEEFELLRVHCLVLVRSLKWKSGLALKILEHAAVSPISVFWQLVNRPMPSSAKAAALDALTAFARAAFQEERWDVCSAMWAEMAKVCLAGQLDSTGGAPRSSSAHTIRGLWLTRLEDQDKEDNGYRARQALFRLFAWMIKGDRSVSGPTENIVAEASLRRSIIDYALIETSGEVAAPAYEHGAAQALQTVEAIAMLAQYSLESFDPERIVRSSVLNGASAALPALAECIRNAGYYAIEAVLSNKPTTDLVTYGASLGSALLRQAAEITRPCLERITQSFLRTILMVLRVQRTYLEVLLPSLKADKALVGRLSIKLPVAPVAIDRSFVHTPERVGGIASLTTVDAAPSLALLAIKVLAELTQTDSRQDSGANGHPSGDLLVRAIVSSRFSQVVLSGFVYRLDSGHETASQQHHVAARKPLDSDLMEDMSDAVSAIDCRMAVLDFLIRSIQHSTTSTGFAHFLLGYLVEIDGAVVALRSLHKEGTATGSTGSEPFMPRSCLHVLVEDLLLGTADPADSASEGDPDRLLWVTDPDYAVQAMKALSLLCAAQSTGSLTVRYLRGQENFSMRLLAALDPIMRRAEEPECNAVLRYPGRTPIPVVAGAFEQFLRFQALINDIAALDTHSSRSNVSYSATLASHLLLVKNPDQHERGPVGRTRSPYLLRALDALDLDFALTGEVQRPEGLFSSIDPSRYLQEDDDGCLAYDLGIIDHDLRVETEKIIASGTHARDKVVTQSRILRNLLERSNVEARVGHATWACLGAWSRLAGTVILSYELIGLSDAAAIFLIARGSLEDLARDTPIIAYKADMLSDVSMQVSSRLCSWSSSHDRASDRTQYLLPLEYILEGIDLAVKGILQESVPETARGALYSTIVDYINMGLSWIALPTTQDVRQQLWQSLSGALDLFIVTVGRDCLNAHQGWRTLALTLLTMLVEMSGAEKGKIIGKLDRTGFLQSMAQSLPSMNEGLKKFITNGGETDADLMVYEAKMECLLQLASFGDGATRLARAGVLHALSRCDYVRARPDVQDVDIDMAEETSLSLTRYYGLVSPVLRLTLGMLQADQQTSYQGSLEFISSNADALVAILGDHTSRLSLDWLQVVLLIATLLDTLGLGSHSKVTEGQPGLRQVTDALASLPGRFSSKARWESFLEATTETELLLDGAVNPLDGRTAFFRRSDSIVAKMQSLLLRSYIGGAGKTDTFEPVFTVGGQLFAGDAPKRASPGVLSLTQATMLLVERSEDLLSEVEAVQSLAEKMQEDAVLADAQIEDYARMESGFKEGMGVSDMRGLAQSALVKAYEESVLAVDVYLTIVEASLILIDRHISFYREKIATQSKRQYRFYDPKSSTGPSPDLIQAWKTEVNTVLKELRPVLEDLADADLSVEKDAEEEQLFLRALIGSLAEVQPFVVASQDI